MTECRGNIILTGMPAAGKSTSGILLAKKAGFGFLDTDILIQTMTGKRLGEIISDTGISGFLETEEKAALGIAVSGFVIATGGSMVYSEKAMTHLKKGGSVTVYLRQDLERLIERMGDPGARGVVCPAGKSLGELYEERHPLYLKYADIVIDCANLPPEPVSDLALEACMRIMKGLTASESPLR